MKRLLLTLLFALALPASAAAQGARAKATPTPTPAARRSTPAAARPTTPAAPRPSPTPATAQPRPAAAGPARGAAAPLAAAPEEDCGCESQVLPDVLATVNGIKIARTDLSEPVKARVRQLQQQVVEARKRELDLQINSRLLEAEAKKRGTTTAKIIEAEIVAKTSQPTEADAQAFYDKNKAQIRGEFKEVKNDIITYLLNERQQEQAGKLAERLRAGAQVQRTVQEATPPATAADRARVLATVNGQQITSGQIEDSLRPLIFAVQEQVYALRKQEVDVRVNDILLNQEAQKRKVTDKAILDEVYAKVPTITEADAQKFYDENKGRINGQFADVKYQIIQFLQEQAAGRTSAAFAQQLRNAASVQTFLVPPEPPVFDIAVDDQPSKGSATARVTLVEFTDYQCPSCAAQHPVLERLTTEYGDRLRLVVRDFPLDQHAHALKAAEAAEAAREQGKYWDYVAVLFRNQSALDVPKLKEYATALGLDRAKFDAALDSGRFADKVQRDLLDGQRLGISATPTLFLNGRRVSDLTYAGLKAQIEAALRAPATK